MSMADTARFLDSIETVQKNIHQWAKDWGFWDEPTKKVAEAGGCLGIGIDGCLGIKECDVVVKPWNFAEKIALVHSELSEALEAHRGHGGAEGPKAIGFRINDIFYCSDDGGVYNDQAPHDQKQHKPEGVAVELADAVIRIMDLCGKMDIDLGRAILVKMAYNRTRPKRHGKAY